MKARFLIKGFGWSVLVIFIVAVMSIGKPSTAQWINPYAVWGPFRPFLPTLSPFYGQAWLNPIFSNPPTFAVPSPLQSPLARIAGTTTIFLPPSAITDIKVLIKPPDLDTIKLEELEAPFTIYLYPEDYTPEALFLSAIIAGGLLPFYPF
ncbi:MAG: hypothetical protein ACMUIL_12570 [bacterium]